MKPFLIYQSFLLFLLLGLSPVGKAQQPDYEYIRSRIVVYYYPAPNTQPATPYPRIADAVVEAFARGTGQLFGGDPGMNRVQDLFGNLLRAPDRGGDRNLQNFVKRILQIRNQRIAVIVYNDAADLNAQGSALNDCQNTVNNGNVVVRRYYWPCAYNVNLGISSSFSGIVRLGRYFFDRYREKPDYCKATFMHEFFHTQDLSDPQFHKYMVGTQGFYYGVDNQHYYEEVIPSIGMAYKEGIANALTFLFNPHQRDTAFKLFDGNGYLLVEQNMPQLGPTMAANPAISPDVWLYNQLVAQHVPLTPAPASYTGYSQVRIRSLPPRLLMYNETVVGLICSQYINLISLNRFLNSVAVRNLVTNPQSDFGELINVMCELGLPSGMTMGSFVQSPQPRVDPNVENLYLLPLVFVDYFTGWQARSASELNGWLNNKVDRGLMDFYWNNFHTELSTRYHLPARYQTGSGSTLDNLTSIAMRFGVRSSDPTR